MTTAIEPVICGQSFEQAQVVSLLGKSSISMREYSSESTSVRIVSGSSLGRKQST